MNDDHNRHRHYFLAGGPITPADLMPGDMPDGVLLMVVMLRPDQFDPAAVADAEAGEDATVGGGMSVQLNCHPLFAAHSLRATADAIEDSYRAAVAGTN